MKFINLNGKRLMANQVVEISKMNADILEPMEELKDMIECETELTSKQYAKKAKDLIDKFEIKEEDYIHINGIDFNLVLFMRKQVNANYVYSKMKKSKSGDFYVTNFITFVKLI